MYFEKVEKISLKDTQHILRLTVTSWLVLKISSTSESLFLDNDGALFHTLSRQMPYLHIPFNSRPHGNTSV